MRELSAGSYWLTKVAFPVIWFTLLPAGLAFDKELPEGEFAVFLLLWIAITPVVILLFLPISRAFLLEGHLLFTGLLRADEVHADQVVSVRVVHFLIADRILVEYRIPSGDATRRRHAIFVPMQDSWLFPGKRTANLIHAWREEAQKQP